MELGGVALRREQDKDGFAGIKLNSPAGEKVLKRMDMGLQTPLEV